MDVLARTKELLSSLADVTESGSKVARYKIEVANLDRKLGLTLRRVGERAWQLQTQGRTDVLGDADVQKAFEEVRQLRARMEVVRQDVERHRANAAKEARNAAQIVRKGAERASTAVREEGVRAVSAVRKAVATKSAARKKPGKETSELQP
jgi:pyridoxal biosynthesis lyase PdxS